MGILKRDEFYADPVRAAAIEVDFGWWESFGNTRRYRVSWIPDTGEVYALDAHTDEVEVLGAVTNRDDIERLMDGWWDECRKANALQWVRERLMGVAA